MVTRPAYVWSGSDWDEIGDARLGSSVTAINSELSALDTALGSKANYPSGGSDGDVLVKDGTDADWASISAAPYIGYSAATAGVSTTSTSFQDIAATITFTAPASGKVLVSVEAIFSVTGGNQDGIWAFRDNSTSATIGDQQIFSGSGADNSRRRMGYQVTGLTSGASLTYKLSIKTGNASYTVSVLSVTGAQVQLFVQEML